MDLYSSLLLQFRPFCPFQKTELNSKCLWFVLMTTGLYVVFIIAGARGEAVAELSENQEDLPADATQARPGCRLPAHGTHTVTGEDNNKEN